MGFIKKVELKSGYASFESGAKLAVRMFSRHGLMFTKTVVLLNSTNLPAVIACFWHRSGSATRRIAS